MVNLDFMSLNKSWWNLLTDTVLFSISSQSSSTQHKDREVCWKTESRFSRAATAAVGQKTQTVADYVIDSSLLLTPELTAHCLEWLFVKWMNWTDMRQQSEANGKKKKKKKRMTASWDVHRSEEPPQQPSLDRPLNVPQGQVVMMKFRHNLSMICW